VVQRGASMRKCVFCAREIAEDASICEFCLRELPTETRAVAMPLCYEHTCSACGNVMTVYDTSYWQMISCSRCGKQFLGNPPMSDEF
jgi:predicted amidophosphoribosyltransferase